MKERFKLKDKFGCKCKMAPATQNNQLLQKFAIVRRNCSALREILVPDDIWSDFKAKAQRDIVKGGQQSLLLSAFRLGYLNKTTSPVHRYLMECGKPKGEIAAQYVKDLQERYMIEAKDGVRRHIKCREHQGKLTELMCAEWLESQGWKISNLAALGGNADIEAASPDNICCAIEVKYLGQEDIRYEDSVKACATGKAQPGELRSYAAYNYLLFRVYQAAQQLLGLNENRIVFLVIDKGNWDYIELPLKDRWLCRRPIRFSEYARDWLENKKKEKKYFNIEKELEKTLGHLKEVWIIREKANLQYELHDIVSSF